jgi:hypothetical protein
MPNLEIDTYLGGALLVGLAVAIAVGGLIVVHRTFSNETLKRYHDVAGAFLSVIGTLYAVLLGLIVVDSMSKFQQAHVVVAQEANSLANIFAFANVLPTARRDMIQGLCEDYVHEVIEREWPAMDDRKFSMRAQAAGVQLWKSTINWEPKTESEKAIYATMLQELTQFTDARRIRLVTSDHGVPTAIWTVLFIGGIFTIVFTYFFGLKDFRSHVFMTGSVSLIIGLNLLLVSFYGYPFSGDVKVYPDEFIRDEQLFKVILSQNAQKQAQRSLHID